MNMTDDLNHEEAAKAIPELRDAIATMKSQLDQFSAFQAEVQPKVKPGLLKEETKRISERIAHYQNALRVEARRGMAAFRKLEELGWPIDDEFMADAKKILSMFPEIENEGRQ